VIVTAEPKQLYCHACMRMQTLDANWLALHIDGVGDLVLTKPERYGEMEYERPGTVLACGQGAALVLVERFLHTRGFNAAHKLRTSASGHTEQELTAYLF